MPVTLSSALTQLGASVIGLSIVVHAVWCAWLVARAAFPTDGACASTTGEVSASERSSSGAARRALAMGVALVWLSSSVFALLVTLGLFSAWCAALIWFALAFALARALDRERTAFDDLRGDLRHAWTRVRACLRSPAAFALVPLAALALAGWARASVAPPLGWDALTYHLVKAARWTQGAGLYLDDGPDAWSYYRWFGWLGDAPWSWAMLAFRSDLGLATIDLASIAVLVLAARELAREAGADELVALALAAVIALAPAVQRFWYMHYVETLLLAAWLAGLVFALRALRTPGERSAGRSSRARDAAFALAAFGACAGIKLPGLALALVGVVPLCVAAARGAFGSRVRMALVASVVALPGFAHYALVAARTGSALYPHTLSALGVTLAHGDQELADVLHGREPAPLAPFLDGLLGAHIATAGFGPAGALVIAAGACALVLGSARRGTRGAAVLLALSALVIASPVFGDDVAALRSRWGPVTGRFLAPAFAACALACITLPRRAALLLFFFALAQDVVLGLPRGWVVTDARALAWFAVLVVPLLALALFALRARGPLGVRGFVAFGLVASAVLPWQSLRERMRAEYYVEAWHARAFEAHPLSAEGHDLWAALDTPERLHFAVTAGFEYPGHNWIVYPLFGSRLQHTLEYVPVTSDGACFDYRERDVLLTRGDERAWIERLVAREIDVLVTLRPRNTNEDRWIEVHPEIFSELAHARRSAAWRVDREAARGWLAAH